MPQTCQDQSQVGRSQLTLVNGYRCWVAGTVVTDPSDHHVLNNLRTASNSDNRD